MHPVNREQSLSLSLCRLLGTWPLLRSRMMIAFGTLDGVLTLGKALFDGQTGSALERQKIPGTLVESSRSWNYLGRVGQRSDNGCFTGGDRFDNRLCPGVASFAYHPDAFGSA